MIEIYTDGACSVNPGIGGWGAVLIYESGVEKEIYGSEIETTNNRMEITAVIKSLEELGDEQDIKIYSDSTYVINTITKNWKRNANNDLWDILDKLLSDKKVVWQWVKGHSGNKYNEIADKLAVNAINELKKNNSSELSHLDDDGSIKMVDVSEKQITSRVAVVSGKVVMKKETLEIIKKGELAKGDIFTLSRTAGITAAKSTPTLIPLCHTIPLSEIKIEIEPDDKLPGLNVYCSTKADWKTGVEIEAFTGVSIACVTIYDMCKAVDKSAYITDIKLEKKSGGLSGDYSR
tara:strand:- start:567 stop:1439 length:873 start_codon:yes stop_codon:yes gene_type:complete